MAMVVNFLQRIIYRSAVSLEVVVTVITYIGCVRYCALLYTPVPILGIIDRESVLTQYDSPG